MVKKKYFVTMTDSFMSDWGKAKGKINKVVVECNTHKQAQTIARNAKLRPEMKYINVVGKMPYYNAKRYLVSLKTYGSLGSVWKRK